MAALPDEGDGRPAFHTASWSYRSEELAAGKKAATIENIPPGKYLVVACPRGFVEALDDTAVWERVKAKAVAVEVKEGETVRAAPRLILESEFDEK